MARNMMLVLTMVTLGLTMVNEVNAGNRGRRIVDGRIYRFQDGRWGHSPGDIHLPTDYPGQMVGVGLSAVVERGISRRHVQFGRYPSHQAALQHLRQQYPVHQVHTPYNVQFGQYPSRAAAMRHLRSRFAGQVIRSSIQSGLSNQLGGQLHARPSIAPTPKKVVRQIGH